MYPLLATLRYVLITAVRDRMVAAILIGQAAVVGGAALLAAAALDEGRATGLAIAGEGLRGIMTLGLITFISFHLRRMEETREIETILTRPISRTAFVLAYYCAYAGIGLLLTLAAPVLLSLVLQAGGAGLVEWQASLMLESLIIVAIALFCALSLGSATASVLAGIGLYLLARMGAFFRAISEAHTALLANDGRDKAARWIIEGVTAVLPRLDLFGQGSWLVHGAGGAWGLKELGLQTSVIVALLLAATIRDIHVKQL